MSVTSVRLQADVESGLEAIAETTQRSKSWLINQALREFIDRQQLEQRRWRDTLQAIDSAANGQLVSGDAVHAWLQSWGSDSEETPPKVGQ